MSKPLKKILLISSGQPSLNPRLVKEADSLVANGYDVTVIYQFWNQWGTMLDEKLLQQKTWNAILVGGNPNVNRGTYWFSRIRYKLAQKLVSVFGLNASFAKMAIGRCTNLLISEAVKHQAELYIAHNLAALPAAVKAAKKNGVKNGFDAEDYHRNEVSDDLNNIDVKLKTFIEDTYIPQVNYLTTSSPQISAMYAGLYHILPVTILNTFPSSAHPLKKNQDSQKLKLFWFSQTISAERGVGNCINALTNLNDSAIELHLLGDASETVNMQLQNLAGNKAILFIHPPIPPDEIVAFASQFDVGLAMEEAIPYNRDICLTNKLFTYAQAGLAIIASDTSAQTQLLKQYPGIGLLYQKSDVNALASAIKIYKDDPARLFNAKQSALQAAAKDLNWEHESRKFIQLINNTTAS